MSNTDDTTKEAGSGPLDLAEGTIHINGEELLYYSSRWEDCGPCYWVNGHKVYILEDGREIMDFATDEGLQG